MQNRKLKRLLKAKEASIERKHMGWIRVRLGKIRARYRDLMTPEMLLDLTYQTPDELAVFSHTPMQNLWATNAYTNGWIYETPHSYFIIDDPK